MKALKIILTVFVTLPIWYYLLYKILIYVDATDLMWFLYIVYIPAGVIAQFIHEAMKE